MRPPFVTQVRFIQVSNVALFDYLKPLLSLTSVPRMAYDAAEEPKPMETLNSTENSLHQSRTNPPGPQ